MNNIQIPFGLRENKIIHILDLNKDEKGYACNCACPECGDKLIARVGDIQRPHFAHKSLKCINSLETALHKFAKEVFQKNSQFTLPSLHLTRNISKHNIITYEYITNRTHGYHHPDIEVTDEYILNYDENVELEKDLGSIIPDILLHKKGKSLIVEVAVTHFIDDEKAEKIKNLGISAIEIDLNSKDNDFFKMNLYDLERKILDSANNKTWIYNVKADTLLEKDRLVELKRIAILEEKLAKKREEKSLREELQKIAAEEREKMRVIISKETKEERLIRYALELSSEIEWVFISQKLTISEYKTPSLLNLNIYNEEYFACDRRLWQSVIYFNFIYNKRNKIIDFTKINEELVESVKIYADRKRNLKRDVSLKDYFFASINVHNTIRNYLRALVEYGILQWTQDGIQKEYGHFTVMYDTLEGIRYLTKSEIKNYISQDYSSNYK